MQRWNGGPVEDTLGDAPQQQLAHDAGTSRPNDQECYRWKGHGSWRQDFGDTDENGRLSGPGNREDCRKRRPRLRRRVSLHYDAKLCRCSSCHLLPATATTEPSGAALGHGASVKPWCLPSLRPAGLPRRSAVIFETASDLTLQLVWLDSADEGLRKG
jgi:hypothetical protein